MKIDHYIENYREFSWTRDKHVLAAIASVAGGIILGTGAFLVLHFFIPSVPDVLLFGTKTVAPFVATVETLAVGTSLTVTALHYHKKVKEISVKNLLDALKEKQSAETAFGHMDAITDKDYVELLQLIDQKYFSNQEDVRLGKRLKRIFWAIGTGTGADKFFRNCYYANVSEAFIKKMGEALALLHILEDGEETYCDTLYQKISDGIEWDTRYLERLGTLDPERDQEQIAEFLKLSPQVSDQKRYWSSILDLWKPFAKTEKNLISMKESEESSLSGESASASETSGSEKKGQFFAEYDFQVDESQDEEYSFSD